MNYTIVNLQQKTVAGLCTRTSNSDPQMGQAIGGLWQKLFGGGVFSAIPNAVGNRSIGLYSGYADGVDGEYDITVGREVRAAEPGFMGTVVKTIPAGRYAEFIVHGDEMQAVGEAWQEIWAMPLERAYTGDFEEYYDAPEGEPREIRLYIAIK